VQPAPQILLSVQYGRQSRPYWTEKKTFGGTASLQTSRLRKHTDFGFLLRPHRHQRDIIGLRGQAMIFCDGLRELITQLLGAGLTRAAHGRDNPLRTE